MSFLQVHGIQKKIRDFELGPVGFIQEKGRQFAIAGETGSGKSTLLKIIGGWISPDAGTVLFKNERVKRIPEEKLVPGHPGIGYLSQQFELPNFLTVAQVLEYRNQLPEISAQRLYELCRVNHLLSRRTDELSGGEKQRIALARVLVSSPELLLLDEPFSNLDPAHKVILKTILRELINSIGLTCLLVSHDPQDSLALADQLIVLQQGKVIQQQEPAHIYFNPVNEYVAGLFGAYFKLSTSIRQALAQLQPQHPALYRIFLRPEDFELSRQRPGIPAVVRRVAFVGHSYEAELSLNDQPLTIRVQRAEWEKDDEVFVRLKDM